MKHIIITEKKSTDVKVNLEDIYYITTIKDKPRVLKIVMEDKVYETYGSLKHIEKLANLNFCRCHRQYLVNLFHIKALDKGANKIIFKNKKIEPIVYSRRQLRNLEISWKKF